MIMSIDQSLSCSGITIWDNEGKCIYFTCVKTKSGVPAILRIREITQALANMCSTYSIECIVAESLPFGINSTSVRPLAGLHMCIQNLAQDLAIAFTESNVTAVKRFATGKGTAKKSDMIDAFANDNKILFEKAAKLYKKTTGLADLADSYWIYKLYRSKNDTGN